MEIPVEKRFRVLCEIVRAQHFAWRDAVRATVPGVDPQQVVNKMWEITAVETARTYLRRIDPGKPLALQVAYSMAFSSVCMGEGATVEQGEGDEAFVKHADCPWYSWHERLGVLNEDRPGCDTWFNATVREINKALGTRLRIETQSALPDGAECCLRRLWVE
ncbi:MAG: hypothetical protein ACE5HE_13385 [Phycisphaerae bacterium]